MTQQHDKRTATPTVSIGMPVYNGEKFIRKALDSLLAQTFTDFELIISDNASTDETQSICEEYASRDKRIRYVRQFNNTGPVANFLFVLNEACGKYFMWAACDDMWNRHCLEKYVNVLDLNPDVLLVSSNYEVFSHVTGFIRKHYIGSAISDNKRNRLLSMMIDKNITMIYGMFRKRDDFISLEQFDWSDQYFIYNAALYGKLVGLFDVLYYNGIKGEVRPLYSITGKRISPWPFYRKTWTLIKNNFALADRLLLWAVLTYQALKMYKNFTLNSTHFLNYPDPNT